MYVTLPFGSQRFPRISPRAIYLFFFSSFVVFLLKRTPGSLAEHANLFVCFLIFACTALLNEKHSFASVSAYFQRAFDTTWLA